MSCTANTENVNTEGRVTSDKLLPVVRFLGRAKLTQIVYACSGIFSGVLTHTLSKKILYKKWRMVCKENDFCKLSKPVVMAQLRFELQAKYSRILFQVSFNCYVVFFLSILGCRQ